MPQKNEVVGFKLTAADFVLLRRAAADDGATSVQRWVRDLAMTEALSRSTTTSAERSTATKDALVIVESLKHTERLCRQLQEEYPSLQVDAAEARNALLNLASMALMAASGGLTSDWGNAQKAEPVPEGWLTIADAIQSLEDRNGCSPKERWFHKARGRGLLRPGLSWRYCLVQRDGIGWRAYCLPQKWVDTVVPLMPRHTRDVDWNVLASALTDAGLLPETGNGEDERPAPSSP